MTSCQKCTKDVQPHDVWDCDRCKKRFCVGCVEPLQTIHSPIRCKECAVYDRIDEYQSQPVVVYEFPDGFREQAVNMWEWLYHYQLHPSWGPFVAGGPTVIRLPRREVESLRQMQRCDPARFGRPPEVPT
jgi:hypothetical protein